MGNPAGRRGTGRAVRRIEEPLRARGDRRPLLGGRYELGELVGSGGMADVRRARDRRLNRDVAVKLLSGPSARSAGMRKRIEREARALASLSHPNVISVYDYGAGKGPDGEVRPYLVMELVEGRDLHEHLADSGPLSVEEATALLRAVLAAVDRAHQEGIVHGDIKPANIIMGPNGPKVGDFGVARVLSEESGTTTIAATPTFAAPEVLRGERPSPASDLYSVACVAFQMLTGRPPYEGANAWEVAVKHMEEPVPSVRDHRPEVPSDLDEAIRRCMDKKPNRRLSSARGLSEALRPAPTTIPFASRSSGERPEPQQTEILPDRVDLPAVALLGPLVDAGEWVRERLGPVKRRARGHHRIAGAVLLMVVAVSAALLLRDGGPELVSVPDVRGMESAAAGAQLRLAGFQADVSFRPVAEGTPDVVIETIPAARTEVEPGSEIHLIASALVQAADPPDARGGEAERRGGGEERKGKDEAKRDKDD